MGVYFTPQSDWQHTGEIASFELSLGGFFWTILMKPVNCELQKRKCHPKERAVCLYQRNRESSWIPLLIVSICAIKERRESNSPM